MTITHDALDFTIQGPQDVGPHCAETPPGYGNSLYRIPHPPKDMLKHVDYEARMVGKGRFAAYRNAYYFCDISEILLQIVVVVLTV